MIIASWALKWFVSIVEILQNMRQNYLVWIKSTDEVVLAAVFWLSLWTRWTFSLNRKCFDVTCKTKPILRPNSFNGITFCNTSADKVVGTFNEDYGVLISLTVGEAL